MTGKDLLMEQTTYLMETKHLIVYVKVNGFTFGEDNSVVSVLFCFCLPSEYVLILKRKICVPTSDFFSYIVDRF